MRTYESYIGYLKYSGQSVNDGLLDIEKSAEALLGFNELLRYFLIKENPDLGEIDFEIPVRIEKGSWVVWVSTCLGIYFTKNYLSAIAKKAGEDGFLETGPAKDVKKALKGSLIAIQWVIKIALHIGTLNKRDIKNIKIDQSGSETILKIPNQQNEYLEVEKKYFDLFVACPEKIFIKNAKMIKSDRILELGVLEHGKEEKISISEKEKFIFCSKEDEENIILPELLHNQYVELEGEITRATESTNSIGFRHKGHVIVCKPQRGNIAQFKDKIVARGDDHFFPKIKIAGKIDRMDKNNEFKEKRPQIYFYDIKPFESDDHQQSLFK